MQRAIVAGIFSLLVALSLNGQSNSGGSSLAAKAVSTSSIPVIVKFSGNIRDFGGTIPSGYRGATFFLYKDQDGGMPLWMETQTVAIDFQGRFTVILGSTSSNGIPLDVFASGDPRWVGLTLDDGQERPRVELASVPYAFKAANADTLGGKGSDEFVTQQQLISALNGLTRLNPIPPLPVPLASGNVDPVQPQNSHLNMDLLQPLPEGAFAKLADNNSFLVLQSFRGGIDLPASNPESNAPSVLDSAPLDFESSSPGLESNVTLTQRFRWISESLSPTSNGPSARLSLLFGVNGAPPSPTGLHFNSDGTIDFPPGQQFPSAAILNAMSGNPGSGSNGAAGSGSPFVNTNNFQWTENPTAATGIAVGPSTVTLKPCPQGMNGTDLWHYIYVSGTGTPEVSLITGGSCTSGAATGTIEFTANYVHPPGYSIGTATAGIQEAAVAADVAQSDGQISRQVIIGPGTHLLRARVSIRSSGMTITSSGATLTCAMSDTCLMVGDPSNANTFNGITLQGLRVAPGVKGGTWPAVEDNAQGSQVIDLAPAMNGVSGASFGSLVQVDNDQAAKLNGISTITNFAWGRCDTTFCSTAILGPGPYSKNAGVLWVQNSNLSLQCGGNGIDNQDRNTLRVTNSVVQGYAQFGVRSSTIYQQSNVQLNGVYEEEDSNCNPLGTGSTGLIVEGGTASVYAGSPAGLLPQFANTGSTQYWYYIVVHSSTFGTSPVYLAGYANTSGSGQITVLWNKVGTVGTITYDVLRIAGDGGPDMVAPHGTGLYAVATGIPASLCSNTVCSVVDNAKSPSSYTVADQTFYWPSLKLWPGTVILTTPFDVLNSGGGNPTQYFTDQLLAGVYVSSAGATYPSVFAQECNPQINWSPILLSCVAGNSVGNDWQAVIGTLMQLQGTGGSSGGLKGRLIFEMPSGASTDPTHVITLADSNPDKTLATPGNRPTNDPNDSYIGYDGGYFPSKMGMSFGAPVSISRYIGNTGDGVNYLERLTSTQEQFQVPVQLPSVPFVKLTAYPDGTMLYCADCQNIADDGVMFDSAAVGGGHGTNLLHENGQWRVH
jgi:hypothetical protein